MSWRACWILQKLVCALGVVPEDPVSWVAVCSMGLGGREAMLAIPAPQHTADTLDFLQAGGKQRWGPSTCCSASADVKADGGKGKGSDWVSWKDKMPWNAVQTLRVMFATLQDSVSSAALKWLIVTKPGLG